MGVRLIPYLAVTCVLYAGCGGDQFDSGGTPDAAVGGVGASGGSGAVSSGGGAAGSGGTSPSGGGGSGGVAGGPGGGSGGVAGSSGGGAGAPSGGASNDGGVDASGPPPISIVQVSGTMTSTELVPTLTFQNAPVAGNSIIVGITCISDFNGDCNLPSSGVTDNQGNAYTQIVKGEPITSSTSGARAYIFITQNIGAPSGSFTISVNPDGEPTYYQGVAWGAIEVAGLSAPPSLDAWGLTLVAGGTGVVSTTAVTDLPTTQANELAVAVLSIRSTDTNCLITPEASWSSHHIHQNNNSGPPAHSMISKILTTTGIVSHTWTHDEPTRGAAGVIATFRGAQQN